jgi:glycosyltransferase involved in cell wall biosynthesis
LAVKISVITATRNAADTLPRLYHSLAQQTGADFEWIVADGRSTDATLELLSDYQRRSAWVRYSSEEDFGVYDALNKALQDARGEFYLVAGADDTLQPDALAQYAELATRERADVVFARVHRAGRLIGGFHPRRAWIGPSRVFASSHSVGTLLRRELHERFGPYSARFPLLADVFFLKLLLKSGSVRFVDAPLIAGTFAEGGLSCVNALQSLAESWQIQMLTEPHRLTQTLLFVGKTLVRWRTVAAELSRFAQRTSRP